MMPPDENTAAPAAQPNPADAGSASPFRRAPAKPKTGGSDPSHGRVVSEPRENPPSTPGPVPDLAPVVLVPAMKRLVACAADKGGVRKSSWVKEMMQWLLSYYPKLRFTAYDPDTTNRTLSAFQPVHTKQIDLFVSAGSQANRPMLDLIEDRADLSILDGLGSQQRRVTVDWAERVNLFDVMQEHSIAVTYVLMIVEDMEVVQQAAELVEAVGNKVDYVIVRNVHPDSELELWDKSNVRAVLMQEGGPYNAREIEFDFIQDNLLKFVRSLRVPVETAQEDRSRVNALDRQEFLNLKRDFYYNFEAARDILLPAAGIAMPGCNLPLSPRLKNRMNRMRLQERAAQAGGNLDDMARAALKLS